MESRLLQAGDVSSPRGCFIVSSARDGAGHRQGQHGFRVSAQRFMRGVQVRQGGNVCGRLEKKVSKSKSVVVAARKSTQGL